MMPYQRKSYAKDSPPRWDGCVVQAVPRSTERTYGKTQRVRCDSSWNQQYPPQPVTHSAARRGRTNGALQREATGLQLNGEFP